MLKLADALSSDRLHRLPYYPANILNSRERQRASPFSRSFAMPGPNFFTMLRTSIELPNDLTNSGR